MHWTWSTRRPPADWTAGDPHVVGEWWATATCATARLVCLETRLKSDEGVSHGLLRSCSVGVGAACPRFAEEGPAKVLDLRGRRQPFADVRREWHPASTLDVIAPSSLEAIRP